MNKPTDISAELKQLNDRYTRIIVNTCNVIGCKDCDLKWDGGCSSSELQSQIMDLEFKEFESNANGSND